MPTNNNIQPTQIPPMGGDKVIEILERGSRKQQMEAALRICIFAEFGDEALNARIATHPVDFSLPPK